MKYTIILLFVLGISLSITVSEAYAIDYFLISRVTGENGGPPFDLGTYQLHCEERLNQQIPANYTMQATVDYRHETNGAVEFIVNGTALPYTLTITDEFMGDAFGMRCELLDENNVRVAVWGGLWDYLDSDYDGIEDWNDPDPNTPLNRIDRSQNYPNTTIQLDYTNSQMRLDYNFSDWTTSNLAADNPQCRFSYWNVLDDFNASYYPNGTKYPKTPASGGYFVPCEGYIIIDILEIGGFHGFTFTSFLNGIPEGGSWLDEIVFTFWENPSRDDQKANMKEIMFGWPHYGHIYSYSSHSFLVMDPDTLKITHVYNPNNPNTKKKSGGGGCADCIPPTMGLDKNGKRVVDYGFSFNGNSVQVEKGHTPYPLINATVGETNLLETKFYENFGVNNMLWVQTCFGATETYQSLNDCEALVEVHLDTDGTTDYLGVKEIKIIDDDNLIDNESVNATSYVTQCRVNNDSLCGKVDLSFEFREAPINHMVITQSADKSGNAQQFSFNEGINVNGKSVNEPPTIIKFGKQSSQNNENSWVTYTRTDKVNDIWFDQNEIEYHRINDNRLERITPIPSHQCTDIPLSEMMVPVRTNCNYPEYVEQQAKKALLIMEKICPSCLLPTYHEMKESFAHDVIPRIDRVNDPEMILLMEQEAQRALEYLHSHRQ